MPVFGLALGEAGLATADFAAGFAFAAAFSLGAFSDFTLAEPGFTVWPAMAGVVPGVGAKAGGASSSTPLGVAASTGAPGAGVA